MQFGTFNQEWISAIRSSGDYLRQSGAIDKARAYLAEKRAEKEPYMALPMIIEQGELDGLADAGRALMRAQGKILRHLSLTRSRADMLALFGVPEMLVPFIDWEHLNEGNNFVVRFDIVPSASGSYFCEINCDTTVAGFELFEVMSVYADAADWPLMGDTRAPHADIALLFERLAIEKGITRVLVCDWSCYRATGHFGFDFLCASLKQALPHLDVRMAYEDDFPADWLAPGAAANTLVYRGFMYADMDDGGAFMARLVDSGATIINTFETEIRSNKCWFAMFFDPAYRHLLAADEVAAIERFVPRTVALGQDQLAPLLRDKADYVFKLNCSSGGKGVFMGAEHSDAELRALFDEHGITNWTAQQYIVSEVLDMPDGDDFAMAPHQLVIGMFLTDERASGVVVRASKNSKIVNVSLGHASCLWAVAMTPERRASLLARIRAQATGEMAA